MSGDAAPTCPTAVAPRGHASVSKKRWAEICEFLRERHGSDAARIDETIRGMESILRFDPSARTYTPEQTRRMTEWKKQKMQALYAAAGRAAFNQPPNIKPLCDK